MSPSIGFQRYFSRVTPQRWLLLGISIPTYGSYTPGSATFQREAQRLAEGIVFTDFPTLPPLDERGRALFEKFKQRFGPLNTWDFVFATGFESFRVMDEAFTAGGNPSDFIRSKTFQGLLGEYRFDLNGDMIGVKNELRRISNGKVEILRQAAN